MSEFKIKLHIKKEKVEGALGIAEIASVLKGLQDTIYDIAEYNTAEVTPDKKKSFRITGKRPTFIEKRAKLTFKSVSKSSFKAEIVGETQVALEGKTMIDESVDLFGTIAYNLNTSRNLEDEIKQVIPDSRHRARIIRVMGEFWPGDENKYDIVLETTHFKTNPLKRERRRTIQHIAQEELRLQKINVVGVLAGAHLIRKRKFELEMQDGKKIECKFKPELHDIVYNLLTKPVVVEGIFTTTVGELKHVADVISVKLLDKVSKQRIITERGELKLKHEIKFDVSFNIDDGLWFFEYPELNIISYGNTYDETIETFQNDFYELYEHYALGDPSKMTSNALNLRKIFKELVEQ